MKTKYKIVPRLICVNRFYYPNDSATSIMLQDLLSGIDSSAFSKHVITSRSPEINGLQRPSRYQVLRGVAIHRVAALTVAPDSLVIRTINFLIFYVASFVQTFRLARRGDIVVCLTDPPLGSLVICIAAWLRGAILVNWVQDIYPEVAWRLGFGTKSGVLGKVLIRMRNATWLSARTNVVIGEHMATYLIDCRVPASKIHLIPNWADEQLLTPLAVEKNPLRASWEFNEADCVIGYSGNLGRAHDIQTMLAALALLGNDASSTLKLLFIGGGAKLPLLREAAERGGDGRFAFRPYQPRSALRESLSVPDVHWLSLEPNLEGLIVPSKFYGAAAVGRPIIFIGSRTGEIARLIEEGECGQTFHPGDHVNLLRYLRELETDPELRAQLGANARKYSETRFCRADRLWEWTALLTSFSSG